MFANELPGGKWTHVGKVFGKQFETPFWLRPGWYSNIFRSILMEENH